MFLCFSLLGEFKNVNMNRDIIVKGVNVIRYQRSLIHVLILYKNAGSLHVSSVAK